MVVVGVTIVETYEIFQDLAGTVELPPSGVMSRVVHEDVLCKVVRIVIAGGSGLKTHKARFPGFISFLSGKATFKVGEKEHLATVGTLVRMDVDLLHSVYAETTTVLLLTLLKQN